MSKYIAKDWSLEKLQGLKVEEQDAIAIAYAGQLKGVKEKRGEVKETSVVIAKLLYVLEVRLEDGKRANVFRQNKSLKDMFEEITGVKPPTHALTLKNAFAFVTGGFITEADFDANSNNCLELAARILDLAKAFTHPVITKVVAELKERSKDEAKNLRGYHNGLKPEEPMTADEAIEAIADIYAAGHGLLVFVESGENIACLPDKEFAAHYIAAAQLIGTLETQMPAGVRALVNLGTPVPVRLETPAPVASEDETVLDHAPAELQEA